MASRSVLLLNSPYTDYTQPYHSLSYLVSPLKQAGYLVDVLDLNIEWFRLLFSSEQLSIWKKQLEHDLQEFETADRWSIEIQIRVTKAVQSLAIVKSIDPEQAIETFQSARFYNYAHYIQAQNMVTSFERVLEYFYPFYPFSLAFSNPVGEPTMADMVEGINQSSLYINDIKHLLESRLLERDYLFCGMSIPFYGSARLGFAALKATKELFPDTPLVAGGTATTDIYKNRVSDATLTPLAEFCDYILPGEADDEIVRVCAWLEDSRQPIPNGLFDLHKGQALKNHEYSHAPVDLSPGQRLSPDYSWVNWGTYLSPEKQVNYSPVRGCFWNKCTFCDYGLNDDLPTAPYRNGDVKQTALDFESLAREGINHIYLAVDSITPAFLRNLGKELLAREIKVNWSTELFLTPNFNPELLALLEQSGFTTASFGYESGSSRVLELMGKGENRVEAVYKPVFEAFKNSPIGLQPKFFFGFPGETEYERKQSIELLKEYECIFPVLTKGNVFDLTEGSIVAKQPEKFGVSDVKRRTGYDINGGCDYKNIDGTPMGQESDYVSLNEKLDYFVGFERPWCGGIDTFHTKLYISHFGRDVFAKIREQYQNQLDSIKPLLSISVNSKYDLGNVFDNVMIYSSLQYSCNVERYRQHMSVRQIQEALSEVSQEVYVEATPTQYTLQIR